MKKVDDTVAPTIERIKLVVFISKLSVHKFEKFYGIPGNTLYNAFYEIQGLPKKFWHLFHNIPKPILKAAEKRCAEREKAMAKIGLKHKKHNRYNSFSKKGKKEIQEVKEQRVVVKRIGVLADLLSS